MKDFLEIVLCAGVLGILLGFGITVGIDLGGVLLGVIFQEVL